MTTTTEALIAHSLSADSFGRTERLALRAAFRADGLTNATVRDAVAAVAVRHDLLPHGDSGARVRDIWDCV